MFRISSVIRYLSCVLVVLASGPGPGPMVAQAQTDRDLQIESVTVGLGGVARVGAWTPIRVVVKSTAALSCVVECETLDPGGSPFVVRQEVSLDANKSTTVELISIPGRLVTDFMIRVRSTDKSLLASRKLSSERSAARSPDFFVESYEVPIWLVVGDIPAVRTRPRASNRKPNPGTPSFRVFESAGFTSVVESRKTDTLDVVLNAQPTGDVVIQVAVADTSVAELDRSELRFNASNWSTPQSILVSAKDDDQIDGSRQTSIGLTRVGADSRDSVTIDVVTQDDEIGVLDQLLSANEFPANWKSLAAYNTIVISGEFDFNEQQTDALQTWTQRGGHLVCLIGSRVEDFRFSLLARWLSKIEVSDAGRLSDVTGFESFVSSASRIPPSRSTGCTISSNDALSLVQNIDGNLAVRSAMGAGRVTICGVDLDKSPFSNWRAGTKLLLKLGDFQTTSQGNSNQTQKFSRSGITELQSQLQIALESGDSKSGRSSLLILGLLLVYLVVIGPGDFALVHRVLKSPSKTWFTFPGLVLLIAFSANRIADSRNGSELSSKQIELIDIDSQTGFIRQKNWFTVYSPENRRYKIATNHSPRLFAKEKTSPLHAAGVRWVGLPEVTYGGMYRQRGVELGKATYSFASNFSAANDLPIPVWSNRVMESEAFGQADLDLVESQLKRSGNGQLDYSSSITHHLSAPIDNWLIVYGTRLYYYDYDLATQRNLPAEHSAIQPGVAWDVDAPTVASQQLSTFMTGTTAYRVVGKRAIDEQVEHEQTKYNPRDTEILPIMRMLTFHDEAGGQQYTSLVNHSMREFELSKLLSLDRAIVIGTVSVPSTDVNINGQTIEPVTRQSFVRIVIPVLDKETLRRALPKVD